LSIAMMGKRSETKLLVALLATVLLCAGVSACGGGKGSGASSQASSTASPSTTTDTTSTASRPEGVTTIVGFGQPASAADKRVITALVKSYYTAAAAEDGAKVCSLIYSIFEEAIAEDYGQPPGPPSLRGKTCPVVMTKLFKQRHKQQVSDLAALKVTGVRIKGRRGFVLLSFATPGKRYITVKSEHGAWKINALVDNPVPSA
jgi:hypothetical protein